MSLCNPLKIGSGCGKNSVYGISSNAYRGYNKFQEPGSSEY